MSLQNRALMGLFAFAAAVLTVLLGWSAFDAKSSRADAQDAQFEQAANAVDALVVAQLLSVFSNAQSGLAAIGDRLPSGTEASAALLWGVAGVHADLPYAYVGRGDGSFLGVLRAANGKLVEGNRLVKRAAGASQREWFSVSHSDDKGTIVLTDNLDPRERPWYQAAVKSEKAVWTQPYADARTGKLTISHSRKLPGASATEPVTVVSVDLLLSQLHRNLAGAKTNLDGIGYVVDSQGQLIAATVGNQVAPGTPARMLKASESDSVMLKAAQVAIAPRLADLQKTGEKQTLNTSADGIALRVSAQRLGGSSVQGLGALAWTVVVAVPDNPETDRLNAHERLLLALALVSAVLTGSLLWQRSKTWGLT